MQLFMQHLSSSAELEAMAEYNSQLTHANMGAALSVVAEFVESQLALKYPVSPIFYYLGAATLKKDGALAIFSRDSLSISERCSKFVPKTIHE